MLHPDTLARVAAVSSLYRLAELPASIALAVDPVHKALTRQQQLVLNRAVGAVSQQTLFLPWPPN